MPPGGLALRKICCGEGVLAGSFFWPQIYLVNSFLVILAPINKAQCCCRSAGIDEERIHHRAVGQCRDQSCVRVTPRKGQEQLRFTQTSQVKKKNNNLAIPRSPPTCNKRSWLQLCSARSRRLQLKPEMWPGCLNRNGLKKL